MQLEIGPLNLNVLKRILQNPRHFDIEKDSPESLSLTTCKELSSPSTKHVEVILPKGLTGSVTSHKFPSRKSFPPTKTKHTNMEESKLVLQKYPTYGTPPRFIPSQALKDDFLNAKDSAIGNLFQHYKLTRSATGNRSPQSECIKKDSTRPETLVTSKKDSPESLSLTTCKQFSSPSTKTSIGDSSKGLTGSITSHKYPSRKSFPPTKTKHTNMEVSKLVLQKYPTYVTPPRSIPSSQALKDDSLNDSTRSETLVTSKKDSPESLSLTTCKQFSSPSTKTSIGDSSRSLTGSVASHKFPSRKSFPPTKTKHTNMEVSKLVLQKYPTYVTPPRSLPSSQALKDDSLNVKDSAIRNLFQPYKIPSTATGYRSPQSECIIKDSERSLTVTPKQRSSSSPQLFKGEPSRSVPIEAPHNLQSPRTSFVAPTQNPEETKLTERVCTKYPAYEYHPRSFPFSHTETSDSLRSLMDPMPVNLYQSNQKFNTEMLSDPSGCLRIPTAINLDQSSWTHSIETFTDSSENVVTPAALNLAQSPLLYSTETFTDTSGNY
ncbi:hypothetical protein TNIN_197031 [Trichonephila inaurata madagascariensis]|uniref:Uncharacterized protein n=1 Tax=Trichonephila inaurata madagascariensis TaxID=2747483 RepID=A0A8X7CH17_9ARAC|nr:hypothetical protein TNIN_197031 [Trichonephila inaurata madagascariensis]